MKVRLATGRWNYFDFNAATIQLHHTKTFPVNLFCNVLRNEKVAKYFLVYTPGIDRNSIITYLGKGKIQICICNYFFKN